MLCRSVEEFLQSKDATYSIVARVEEGPCRRSRSHESRVLDPCEKQFITSTLKHLPSDYERIMEENHLFVEAIGAPQHERCLVVTIPVGDEEVKD